VRRALIAVPVAGAALSGAIAIALASGGSGRDASPARSDRWTPLSDATLERTEVAAARVGGSIYVVGGFEEQSGVTTAAVERYDIRRDRWRRVASMPEAVNHPTAVAHRGRLYVHGGYSARRDLSSATGALQRYDPRRGRWARLPSSPTARAAHALGASGGRLYAAGGSGERGSLRTMEVYDVSDRRWRKARSFPGPARNHTTGLAAGGFFYVLAGRDQGNFAAVDRYNIRRGRWERLPDMRTPRGGIASVRVGRRIVVLGGEELGAGGTTIAEVESFDPRTRRWTRLPSMRTPRHGLGAASLGRRVYALEGGPRPGFHFSRAIEFLDIP
jgi:N-acetylneuraminic acid mutarotase